MVAWLEDDPRPTMTDADFLCAVLSDGKAHTTNEILHSSFKERGCGLTVHSRAADLRKRGLNVGCRALGKRDGRNVFEYQLLPGSLPKPEVNRLGPDASGSENELSPQETGTAVESPSVVPDIAEAGGSLPCSPVADPDDSPPGRHPSFAKQLEIWSAA